MKRRLEDLKGFAIGATDGEIGKIKDFYFDDLTWTIRYIVVQTGTWFIDRKVLISPSSIMKTNWDEKTLEVNLSKDQVKNSPDIDTDKPVYRQQETEVAKYYNWPQYWTGGFGAGSLWAGDFGTTGMMLHSALPQENEEIQDKKQGERANFDPHLRSTEVVTDYDIRTIDGTICEVEDFIIDENTWEINYIIVEIDKDSWFPDKKVIISPRWIKEIQWDNSAVTVNATENQVKNSPEYQDDIELSEAYEANLKNYYGRIINHK